MPIYDNIGPSLVWIARDALASVEIESFIFDLDASQIMNIQGRLAVPIRRTVYADTADEASECLRELGIEK